MRLVALSFSLVLMCLFAGCDPTNDVPTSTPGDPMSHPELDFFNEVSGTLKIELSEPAEKIGELDNEKAPPQATIVSVKLDAEYWEEDTGDFRPLTPEELVSIAYIGDSIVLAGEAEIAVTHQAPNGKHFTVSDLIKAVEETERQTRGQSEWFDGVDVHHVFFEGLEPNSDGSWQIIWGS